MDGVLRNGRQAEPVSRFKNNYAHTLRISNIAFQRCPVLSFVFRGEQHFLDTNTEYTHGCYDTFITFALTQPPCTRLCVSTVVQPCLLACAPKIFLSRRTKDPQRKTYAFGFSGGVVLTITQLPIPLSMVTAMHHETI